MIALNPAVCIQRPSSTIATITHWFLLSSLIVLAFSCAAFGADIPLQTELKVSGPQVTLRLPLGTRYRPGCAFPVELRVQTHSEFLGEVEVREGTEGAARYGPDAPVLFSPHGSRRLAFPVRAPAVSAGLTLSIREPNRSATGRSRVGALRFQASLERVMKPLAPDASLIISCGQGPLPFSDVIHIAAADFPEDDWIYESIDLIVLADGSLKQAPAASRQALRRWLAGGGRLLIASSEALAAAAEAQLLPLKNANTDKGVLLGADRAWWEINAGMKTSDVLAESGNRPVYARLRSGLGSVVFLFPGSKAEDAGEFGTRILSHEALKKTREKRPDLRVQPDRYNAFSSTLADPASRRQSQLWILLGAIVFLAALALSSTSRSWLMAAGWPVTLGALLLVMIAKWYPVPQSSVARVSILRVPRDGSALIHDEWTLLQSHREPIQTSIDGPENGTLTPLFADTGELKNGDHDLLASADRLHLKGVLVQPAQPALFQATRTTLHSDKSAPLKVSIGSVLVTIPSIPASVNPLRAVWVRANGSVNVITQKNRSTTEYHEASFDDWPALLRADGLDERAVKANATALGWIMRDAIRSKKETLIFWGRNASPEVLENLIEIENQDPGERLIIATIEL